jgi:hypothetical protein
MARTHLNLTNLTNRSVIDGEATNGNIGRGGRRKAFFADEFAACDNGQQVLAATADMAPCRIWVSTPMGMGNAFAWLKFNAKIQKVSLHWTKHPDKARGLYRVKDGQIEILDKTYPFAADYRFLESGGKLRSPWYDAEADRRSPMEVAQELDIDYLTSGHLFFETAVLARVKIEDCRPPSAVGELYFSVRGNNVHLHKRPFVTDAGQKRMKMWMYPDPDHRYVLAVDISQGQGASNSVIAVADKHTGEKVAEWVCPNTMPHELARVAMALSKFYRTHDHDAFIIWEANGPGMVFGKELRAIGCKYYYRQRDERKPTRDAGKVPGWHSTPANKELLLSELRTALSRRDFILTSVETVEEAFQYVYYEAGGIGPAQLEEQSNGARAAHGDRVIADALLWLGLREISKFKPPLEGPPPGSYAHMKAQRTANKNRDTVWS